MIGESRLVASGQHVMKQFMHLEDGAPMTEADEHFPVVCRNGEPAGVPARLQQ